jgi:plastocyanin
MKISVFLFLLLAVFLAGCAPRFRLSPAYIVYQGEPVEIEMENFSFKPNHLSVLRNQSPIILHLKNRDGISHNFTLMAPDGDIISSQDLESKESVTVDLGFLNSENYVFYCFFHQYRGMKGMLMVD